MVKALQQELESTLEHKNTVRAFIMAAGLLVLSPVYIIAVENAGIYADAPHGFVGFLVAFAIFQAAMAAAGFFIIYRNESEWQKIYYRSGFGGSLVMLAVIAAIDRMISESMISYFVISAVAVLLPVFELKEQTVIMLMTSASAVISAVVCHFSGRSIFDIFLWCIITTTVAMFVHSRGEDYERMAIKLREQIATSEKDHLTGLANRRGLDKKASMLWLCCERSSVSVGIIEIDIDFFKKYNDKFGHPAGDECLRHVADAIKKSAQRCSDISARTGGEEFVVIAQNMNSEQMATLALKIRKAISELKIPHAYNGISNYVTVSMGVASMTPSFDNSFTELYQAADDALYRAKENGRNCIVCGDKVYGRMKNGAASAI